MCKGCEIRTRLMVAASAELDTLTAEAADALANGNAGGQAEALSAIAARMRALAVRIAGPTVRAKAPTPPAEEAPQEPAPQPASEPQPSQGFTHAARAAAAMERDAA